MKKNKKRANAAGAFSATRSDRNNPEPSAVSINISDPFGAREALENDDLTAVGRYLRDDIAPLLKLIADQRQHENQKGSKPLGYDEDDEFEYETEDVRWAIENGKLERVAGFLRRLAPLVASVGDMLAPDGRSEFQLKPGRRRSGKPRTREQEEFEERVHHDLRLAIVRAGGKLEAAVAEVSSKHGISRATVFKIRKQCGCQTSASGPRAPPVGNKVE